MYTRIGGFAPGKCRIEFLDLLSENWNTYLFKKTMHCGGKSFYGSDWVTVPYDTMMGKKTKRLASGGVPFSTSSYSRSLGGDF